MMRAAASFFAAAGALVRVQARSASGCKRPRALGSATHCLTPPQSCTPPCIGVGICEQAPE
eukprot:2279280-Alexandrium_andersonii.AAC.1